MFISGNLVFIIGWSTYRAGPHSISCFSHCSSFCNLSWKMQISRLLAETSTEGLSGYFSSFFTISLNFSANIIFLSVMLSPNVASNSVTSSWAHSPPHFFCPTLISVPSHSTLFQKWVPFPPFYPILPLAWRAVICAVIWISTSWIEVVRLSCRL